MSQEAHALIRHQEIGTAFEGTYYVESAFVKQTVQKKDYTDMMLRDKSGARNVKFWGRVDGVAKGDFVFIAANVQDYQGNPSIVAANVEKAEVPADMSDYVPVYDDSGANSHVARFDSIRAELAARETVTGNSFAGMLVDAGLATREGGAVRLAVSKLPLNFFDTLSGPIAITEQDRIHINGLVLLRSDGEPTYHFASVVDDMDFEVTWIVPSGLRVPWT